MTYLLTTAALSSYHDSVQHVQGAIVRLKPVRAVQVAADVSTASPAWGTDALYLLIATGLAGAAWGSRSAP